ncbi:YbgA family protein [Vibrio ruber]|uniref:YbgA family protein n=1 Tax=Vibrio ruber TaxID=184755 RepID=UPI0035E29C44
MMEMKIPVGVSSCVTGQQVRFDGGHKKSHFVMGELAPFCEFIPVCPEVGAGMSTPRPTIRQYEKHGVIRLVETKNDAADYTDQMASFTDRALQELGQLSQPLCGYVVAAKSPTCGMKQVKVYHDGGVRKEGVGLYTEKLMATMPWLPVEEDGRLNDPNLRENFILRVFCLHDLYQSVGVDPTPGNVVAFHSRYKFTLMAHSPQAYRSLGRMVAHMGDSTPTEFFEQYRLALMQALAKPASRKNSTNVLMHFQGYFKQLLEPEQKAELTRIIHEYRQGLVPLLVPVTLIQHYLTLYPNPYLAQQHYLNPYPQALKLRYGL